MVRRSFNTPRPNGQAAQKPKIVLDLGQGYHVVEEKNPRYRPFSNEPAFLLDVYLGDEKGTKYSSSELENIKRALPLVKEMGLRGDAAHKQFRNYVLNPETMSEPATAPGRSASVQQTFRSTRIPERTQETQGTLFGREPHI